jgi:glycosyltransferase involved in cell wall biosynthesis
MLLQGRGVVRRRRQLRSHVDSFLFLNNYSGTGIGDFGAELEQAFREAGVSVTQSETSTQLAQGFTQQFKLLIESRPLIANLGLTAWGRSPIRNITGFIALGLRALLGRRSVVLLHHVIEVLAPSDTGYKVSSLVKWGAHLAVRMLRAADLVVFGEAVSSALRSNYGMAPALVRPLPCRRLRVEERTPRWPSRPRAVFVGYIAPYKGLDLLAEAWKELSDRVSLTIVGEPHRVLSSYAAFRLWLDTTYTSLRSVDATLAGRLADPELDQLLDSSTIGLLPYSSTSGGTAAFTRLASAQLPVVATNQPEFVWLRSQGAGILIADEGADGFRRAVLKLTQDPGLWSALSAQQRSYVEHHSWQEFVRDLLTLVDAPPPPKVAAVMNRQEVDGPNRTRGKTASGPIDPTDGSRPPGQPRPRIALVCRILWNGGVQRVAISQVEQLRRLGYDADLIFLRQTSDATYAVPPGTTIISVPLSTRPFFPFLVRITAVFAGHRGPEATVDVDLLWRLRHRLRTYDAVVYSDQFAAWLGAYLRLLHGKPYLLVFHEFLPKVRTSFSRRVAYLGGDVFDMISLLFAPAILTTSRLNFERIRAIRPRHLYFGRIGCPKPPESQHSINPAGLRQVLALSVWDEGRHPEVFLEIARKNPDYSFVIAGSWPEPEFFARFRQLVLSMPNVRLTGTITEQERLRLLAECRIYLRFGFHEAGPGMGGLEALAAGNIVVANRDLGISELLTHEVNGFIAETPTEPDATKILRGIAMLTSIQVQQISENAKALAAANGWETHGQVLSRALSALGVPEPTGLIHDARDAK